MGESSDTPYSRLEETDDSKTVSVPSPHWRSKYNFIWIFQNNVFCSCVHFSIVMPSIYAYVVKHGGSDYFFASVLFIYSLGELLGSLLFGYIHNYLATRTTMQSGLSLGLIGSVMYFTADYVGDTAALVLIFLARMLQGLWSGGQQACETSYISEVVDKPDMMKVIAEISISSVVGFIAGPLLGLALALVDIRVFDAIVIDSYTSPGYIQALMNLLVLLSITFRFKEIPHETRPYRNPPPEREIEKPDKLGVMTSYILWLFVYNAFSVYETVTTPLVIDKEQRFSESFGWDISAVYVMYACGGVCTIGALVFIHYLSTRMDNRIFAYIGLAVGVVGLVLMIDFEERVIWHPAWFLGYALVTVSMPLGRTSTVSMLSKIIGPTRAGGYMGWYLCIGSIARCVGPFWAVKALSVSIRLCFGSTAAFLIACSILLWATWRNCEPHPEFIRQAANEQQAKKNS